MPDCRTCLSLDCINPSDYDIYSLQQPSIIEAAQSGRITLSDISGEFCVGDEVNLTITATGSSVDGFTTWDVLGGSLPAGLTLNPSGSFATITGTLTEVSASIFSILVEASNGDRVAKVYRVPVENCVDCNTSQEIISGSITGVPPNQYFDWDNLQVWPGDIYIRDYVAGDVVRIFVTTPEETYVDIYDPLTDNYVGYADSYGNNGFLYVTEPSQYRFEIYTWHESVPVDYSVTITTKNPLILQSEITQTGTIDASDPPILLGKPGTYYELTLSVGDIVELGPVTGQSPGQSVIAWLVKPPYTDSDAVSASSSQVSYYYVDVAGTYRVYALLFTSGTSDYSLDYKVHRECQ